MAAVILKDIYKSFPARKGDAQPSALPVGENKQRLPRSKSQESTGLVSVLKAINLTIRNGEFMVLVGPSGCGKSTLLRLIAGLDTPSGGTIEVGDRLVNDLPPKERDIAMVFQSYALYPHMTVFDNLAFGLRRTAFKGFTSTEPQTVPGQKQFAKALVAATRILPKPLQYQSPQEKAIATHVQQVAGMLQIEGLLNRLPKQLSGGQKQRVALGRAMARNPQVFLMDEPLSNLDAKLRAQTRAQIVKLQKQLGTTTIYVTHDQTEAMTMGDRIAVMNGGVIQQLATPLELYNTPANRFVAGFIGSPPMNFIRMQIQDEHTLQHSSFQINVPPSWHSTLKAHIGESIDLGIRPEHLRLGSQAEDSIPVTIELIEALGHETYLSVALDSPGTALIESQSLMSARVSPEDHLSIGDMVYLKVLPHKMHLFNSETGEALHPPS